MARFWYHILWTSLPLLSVKLFLHPSQGSCRTQNCSFYLINYSITALCIKPTWWKLTMQRKTIFYSRNVCDFFTVSSTDNEYNSQTRNIKQTRHVRAIPWAQRGGPESWTWDLRVVNFYFNWKCLTQVLCIPDVNIVLCIDQMLQKSLKFAERPTDKQTE